MLKNISNQTFQNDVLDSKIPVLVDFWAEWCGPCKMMGPILEEIANKFDGKIDVVKINIDEEDNEVLSEKYGIMSIPNMKIFKNGNIVQEFVGVHSIDEISSEIEKLI